MSSVMGDRDFLLDHEQLRSLAKVMYYQEAEAIHNTNFKSEDELAHYLSHSKSNYQSVIGLLDSASDAATKFQSAAAPASDAASPADAAPTAAAWHRANVDYACYIVNTLNVAFQHVKDFNVRFYYVRKLRKHCKSLESRLIEMQPLNPSQPPAGEDNVPGPAAEQTSPGEVPSPSDRVPDGGPDTKTAPAKETEDPTELDKLLDGEHGETMEVLPETNVAEELANLRTASQEYANAAINRAPGSTIDISEFHKQLERARVSLGYEKPFWELKNGQKLKVFNKILEENKVIKVLDGVGKVANAGLLLLTVVLIAWDVSAAPPEQRGTKLARESLVALGAYLAPEAVSAVSSAVLDAAGVDVAGFAVALGVSEVFLSAVAIGTGIGIGIMAGLAVGWIFDAIYNYESSYPLTTEGHKVFVVPKPDVKALSRRTAIQSFENATNGPITNETLAGKFEYMGNPITRTDRARIALNMKNGGNKYVNTKEHAFSLARAQYNAATICLIYNATGDTITLRKHAHYWGKFEPSSYYRNIPNGQWAAFVYGGTSWALQPSILHGEIDWERPIGPESETAVLYRGKNEAGQECDWMLAWSSPCKAYTEIKGAYYFKESRWNEIVDKIQKSDLTKQDEWNGCLSYVSIEFTDEFPVFEAILTLKNA